MFTNDYIAQLLNLEDVIITNVENISDELHIYLELPRESHICPHCLKGQHFIQYGGNKKRENTT